MMFKGSPSIRLRLAARLFPRRRSPVRRAARRQALSVALPVALPVAVSVVLSGTLLVAALPSPAAAQPTIAVQGVAALEAWSTDSGSVLLTRNGGHPGLVGRLHLWSAMELGPRVVAYAAGTFLAGNARREEGAEWYTDLVGVRVLASDALVLDAGRIAQPVGAFASRRYPDRNPVVGTPDGYPVQYPWGLQLSGVRGAVDYRAALVSLPVSDERYLPAATPYARPAFGLGFTPTVGVHAGIAGTWGPYLDCDLPASQLAGRPWHSYDQRLVAVEAQLSRGYLELRGELGAARYDVPGTGDGERTTVRGLAWYAEAKYTITPRLFAATRLERNDYAYIQPLGDGSWLASPTDMYNAEVAAGYRLGAGTLLKGSVRADRWKVAPELRPILQDGVAVAVQLSRSFDVLAAARHDR